MTPEQTTIDINDPKLDIFQRGVNIQHDVELEDIEIAALAKQAAIEDKKLDDIAAKSKETRTEWAEKLERQERVRDQYRADIARGKQTRVTKCDQIFRAGNILSFDPETGVVVHSRPASLSEAQKTIPQAEGGGLLADAARAQKSSGVAEDADGDVIPPEDGGDEAKKRGGKKR